MKRYMALGAVLVALGAGGAALGQKAAAGGAAAAQTDGGLSVMPAVVEHGPQPGPLGDLHGREPFGRPAGGHGDTAPVGAGDLGQGVRQPAREAAGRERRRADVHARPRGAAQRDGDPHRVAVGRLAVRRARSRRPARRRRDPQGRRARLPASSGRSGSCRRRRESASSRGAPKASRGTAVISIRNTGNTADPVGGSVTLRSAGGSRTRSVQGLRILPGKSVNIPLGTKLAARPLHGGAAAHPARQGRAVGHQAVHGEAMTHESRPNSGRGGYARSVGARERSDSVARVLGATVVTKRKLEGKR